MWQFLVWLTVSMILFGLATIFGFKTKDAWEQWRGGEKQQSQPYQSAVGNNNSQIIIIGNNNRVIIPSQPIPKSESSPIWRTIELSSSLIPPFGVRAVKLAFASEKGTIEGIVKVQGAGQLYHFDTISNPEVSVPLPRDCRVLEFAIMKTSSANTQYSVQLRGFEFSDDFFKK